MKFLSQYIRDLFDTLSSPLYYRQLLQQSWWKSIKFFAFSYLLLGLLAAYRFNTHDLPNYSHELAQSLGTLEANYPAELVLSWDGQTLTSNSSEPLELNYPEFVSHPSDFPTKLAIYLPTETTDPHELTPHLPHTTLFMVTKNRLFMNTLRSDWNTIPLYDTPGFEQPFEITAANLPKHIATWQQQLDENIALVKMLTPFLFILFLPLFRIWSSVLDSLLGWLLFRIANKPLPYKRVFQLSLHISVAAEIVSQLSQLVTPQATISMFSLTYWILAGLVIAYLIKTKTHLSGIKV